MLNSFYIVQKRNYIFLFALEKHRVLYSIEKADSLSLGILTIVLPTIIPIYICLSNTNQYYLILFELTKIPLFFLFDENGETKRERWLMYLLNLSGLTGLEPAASALTGRCSDQLNYNPREIRIRDLAEILILFYSYSSVSGIYEGQGGSGYIRKLLGRAGFEPA